MINKFNAGAQFIAPASPKALNRPLTLGQIIRTFKAATSHHIHKLGIWDFVRQDNYYERVIRKDELERTRQYIIDNPMRWTEASLDTGGDFL